MHTRCSIVAALAGACLWSSAMAMSGKAVTSVSSSGSALIVVTVADNVVTRTDTIVPRVNGVTMTCPTFSPDGKRIAFFKSGAGLSVVDIDGKNMRTLGSGGAGMGMAYIYWTSLDNGKRIYYYRGSGQIWRVNVDDTTRKALICDYTRTDVGGVNFCNFSLSTDAKYCVTRALGPSVDALGYPGGGWAHTFPPTVNPSTGWIDPSLTKVQGSDLENECNQGISVSGKLMWHFSGQHTSLYGDLWNHATNTAQRCNPHALFNMYTNVQTWLKPSPVMADPGFGVYLFAPHGSSNSDKVVTILILWEMAQQSSGGANMVVVNWKDQAAVMVTSNPASTQRIAEPGDFYLDGGPANSYQELDGTWTSFPGATAVGRAIDNARTTAPAATVRDRPALYNIRGARVGALDAGYSADRANLRGVYVAAGQGAVKKAVVIGNGSSAE